MGRSRSQSRSRSGSRSSRHSNTRPDSTNFHPDPSESGRGHRSGSRHSRASTQLSHHTAAESLASSRSPSKAARTPSKASLASSSKSPSKASLAASTTSSVSHFDVAEPNASTGTVSKKLLYIVIGVAVAVAIITGLIGYYAAPRGSGAAAPTKAPPPGTSPAPTLNPKAYFLPKAWTPSQYRLQLRVNMPDPLVPNNQTFAFTGQWQALITCSQASSNIVMSMANLVIQSGSIKLRTPSGGAADVSASGGFSLNAATQMVTIPLSGACTPGRNYSLSLTYSGVLETHLYGFYRSRYMENGGWRYMAVTQMQPTDARRAFPCWDEPAFKARFSLQITAPAQYQALGNGIRTANTVSKGWRTTTFSNTPRMSTYLVAFSVLDFDYVERNTSDGKVRFRIWARRALKPYLTYAAKVGVEALELYTKTYKIPFPLPKQDMLACPDFGLGAMENWGLVTYREQSIIYQAQDPPNIAFRSATRQSVAVTITHELSHQWFGDLVTMAWWNDAFLNEGMADYIEYIGADAVAENNGSLHMAQQFVLSSTQPAMLIDQTLGSRPITASSPPSRAATANAINQFFDTITYSKGGSMMRMLSYTLGQPLYNNALTQYLRTYQYSNANHRQYFASLTKSAQAAGLKGWGGQPLNVSTFMLPWVEQMGFPLLTANRSGNLVRVTQSRFLVNRNGTVTPSPYGYQWYVPVWYQAGAKISGPLWLQPGKTLTIRLSGSPSFFLLNYQVRAFYRVNYDAASWTALATTLSSAPNSIDVRNRAQLLNDAINLAVAGQIDYGRALGLLGYLAKETSYIPWKAADQTLLFLDDMFSTDANYGLFRRYMLSLVTGPFTTVGWFDWEPTAHVMSHYARALFIGKACRYELPACLTQAATAYRSFHDRCKPVAARGGGSFKCTTVSADLRRAVYCQGVASGSAADFALLWQLYLQEAVQDERINLLYGLACTRESWLVRRLLNEALSATNIRSQDVRTLLTYLSYNPVGRQLLWSFLTGNWPTILAQYGQSFGNYFIGQIVGAATRSFHSTYQIAELKGFIAANAGNLGGGTGAFAGALANAQANQAWMNQNYNIVVKTMNASLSGPAQWW